MVRDRLFEAVAFTAANKARFQSKAVNTAFVEEKANLVVFKRLPARKIKAPAYF